ncbi:hypothetical protein BGX28_005311 [Mortierella sp. GBA30]|nr:hypothetical protein BGX28_005311 [Mortierella sp. GBA30]
MVLSMITHMAKPSTPQLEEEFTALLRTLEQRHKVKMLAIGQGFKELMTSIQGQRRGYNLHCKKGAADSARWSVDPQVDKDIEMFFSKFYTVNLGTRLLIGEHLALHDHGLNLVQRVSPLAVSKRAIQDAHRVCSEHYGHLFPSPSVLIQTSNPDITATYVDKYLYRNIYELLKVAMGATCEGHLRDGSPMSTSLLSPSSRSSSSLSEYDQETTSTINGMNRSTTARPIIPPVNLTLVDGNEDVTIRITDQGGGLALSDVDKIWSYVRSISGTTTSPMEILAREIRRGRREGRGSNPLLTSIGGSASDFRDFLDQPLSDVSGHGLPLVRLTARYFGGDLSLIPMEGYGTHAYLSLLRNDDYLENIPEVDEEILAEIDVFINELFKECITKEQQQEEEEEQQQQHDLEQPVAGMGSIAGIVPPLPELVHKPTRSALIPSSLSSSKPSLRLPSMALGLNTAANIHINKTTNTSL